MVFNEPIQKANLGEKGMKLARLISDGHSLIFRHFLPHV